MKPCITTVEIELEALLSATIAGCIFRAVQCCESRIGVVRLRDNGVALRRLGVQYLLMVSGSLSRLWIGLLLTSEHHHVYFTDSPSFFRKAYNPSNIKGAKKGLCINVYV